MESFFEPNYEADRDKSTRYRIWLKDEPAFAVAGLWRDWPDGLISFGLFTVDASQHPIMSRMHRPDKEKRSIVIVPRERWDDWLECRNPELARTFMRLYPANSMDAAPDPVPPRPRKAAVA
ncbi:Abasic site processing protein [Cupriavidus sp. H18C1]